MTTQHHHSQQPNPLPGANNRRVIIVPPLHPEVLAKRGKDAMPPPAARTPGVTYLQQLYTRGCAEVVNVPADAVVHVPKGNLHITKLVICSNFDPARPLGSCAGGRRCKFVHVMTPLDSLTAAAPHSDDAAEAPATTTAALRRFAVHINFAWRKLEDVTYERFPAGRTLYVAAPHDSAPSDVMDAAFALKTKALEQRFVSTLTHCAHYYFNRTCNLGSECRFVHAVFIDPSAKDHQRAPAPVQLGRQLQAHSGPPVSSTAPLTDGHTVHNAQLNPPGVWVPPAAASVFRAPRFELNDGDDDRSSDGSAATPTAPHTDSGRGRWQHRAYDAKPRAASANGAPSPSTSDDKSPSSATTTTLT